MAALFTSYLPDLFLDLGCLAGISGFFALGGFAGLILCIKLHHDIQQGTVTIYWHGLGCSFFGRRCSFALMHGTQMSLLTGGQFLVSSTRF